MQTHSTPHAAMPLQHKRSVRLLRSIPGRSRPRPPEEVSYPYPTMAIWPRLSRTAETAAGKGSRLRDPWARPRECGQRPIVPATELSSKHR